MVFILIYLLAVNSYALYVMYNDKKKSKKGYWRIPEDRLFIIALLFGSPGIFAGMKFFRHKTRHFKFVYGIPAIMVIQIIILFKVIQWIYF
jgi:uncharacterized membrane protein YsdA (DUF1294 family)